MLTCEGALALTEGLSLCCVTVCVLEVIAVPFVKLSKACNNLLHASSPHAFENPEHWLHEEQLHEALHHDILCPSASNTKQRMHLVHRFSEDLDARAVMHLFAHEALQHVDSDGISVMLVNQSDCVQFRSLPVSIPYSPAYLNSAANHLKAHIKITPSESKIAEYFTWCLSQAGFWLATSAQALLSLLDCVGYSECHCSVVRDGLSGQWLHQLCQPEMTPP